MRVRQHHVRGQDVLGQEFHVVVPGRVREGPRHDHGAEVMQNVYLVRKDPMAWPRRAVQPDAIRRGRAQRLAPTPPDPAPPMFEILVLRPTEVPRRQQLLAFTEEPYRHTCGQSQRQSSRVARDTREPGPGEGVGINIDAGGGRSPRCARHRYTQVKTPFSGRASGPGRWWKTIQFPRMTHQYWRTGVLLICQLQGSYRLVPSGTTSNLPF